MMASAWKNECPGILALGRMVNERSPDQQLSARSAARLLFGPVRLATESHGVDETQRACADLVRCDAVWATKFGTLPRGIDGRVPEVIVLIAGMARGILPMAGADHLRAALAFWATEGDPAVWREMAPSD
jgi:hypothetical protein